MKAQPDKFHFLTYRKPWSENPNNIWLASTLHLYRNITGYPFPGKLQPALREQVRDLVTAELTKCEPFSQESFVPSESLGPLEKEFLFEHYLSPIGFQDALSGEGFMVDAEGSLFAAINVLDHLHLQIIDCQEELEQSWNQLTSIEMRLGRALHYSYSSRFGFLTAEPQACGTGLRVQLYMHLPALIQTGSLQDTLEHLGSDVVEVTGMQGSLTETPGDFLVVSNRYSLGLTDENILQALRTYCLKLHVAEKSLRGQIAEQQTATMKDRVARSFGVLIHSYQLETIEAWSSISLLKLGIDLGWVEGITHAALNELLFTTRRAHLVCEYSEELTSEELPHRRAEFVHAALSHTQLTI